MRGRKIEQHVKQRAKKRAARRSERRREGEKERHGRTRRRAGANLACQEVAYSSRTKASPGTRARLEAALGTYRSVWMVEDGWRKMVARELEGYERDEPNCEITGWPPQPSP